MLFGTNTAHAAHFIYPRVYKYTVVSLCISILEFLICIIALYKPIIPLIIYQLIILILAIAFQVVVIMSQGLGSNTSITDGTTWKDYTGCSKSYDAPYYAYFTFSATQSLTFIITFIAILPQRCKCFHLVAFDDRIDDGESLTQTVNLQPPSSTRSDTDLPADNVSGGYYDSGIDYRMSLALKVDSIPSYSPPTYDDPQLDKI